MTNYYYEDGKMKWPSEKRYYGKDIWGVLPFSFGILEMTCPGELKRFKMKRIRKYGR